jgi:hypothetical protein
MTGKLRPDEMLRRLDLIAERRAQARARRRQKATTRRADERARAGRSDGGERSR